MRYRVRNFVPATVIESSKESVNLKMYMFRAISLNLLYALLLVSPCLLLAGCGSSMVKVNGQVLKGGQPFLPGNGEVLQVIFWQAEGVGDELPTHYPANVRRQDATFRVLGVDAKGIPPGKYRVSVKHLRGEKDLLNGAFSREKTPFVRDVTGTDVIIDLDKPSD